ncbi:MAG: hypothetical protein EOM91_13510 [Sphingobacteriia bacterium]|nr:hypothetical protein [Sphingobacteriia bacterium]NCC40964.1 hypothetical protein [Gammaproteobacteria bacterium]
MLSDIEPVAPAPDLHGWQVELLGEPLRRRRLSQELPSLFVLVLGLEQENCEQVRDVIASALFGDQSWVCVQPPGGMIDGGLLPQRLGAVEGRVSYATLATLGDSAGLIDRLFPYLDGVFRVDSARSLIEEWELEEGSLGFGLKFELMGKPPQRMLELIEFMLE